MLTAAIRDDSAVKGMIHDTIHEWYGDCWYRKSVGHPAGKDESYV